MFELLGILLQRKMKDEEKKTKNNITFEMNPEEGIDCLNCDSGKLKMFPDAVYCTVCHKEELAERESK